VGLTSPFWGGPGGPGGPCLGSEAKPKAPGVPGVPALVPAPLGKPGKFHQWRNFHQQKWLWNLKVENVTASLWKTRIPSCNFTRSIGPFSSMIYLSNCWFSWTFHISDYYRDLQGIYRVSVMVIQDADAHSDSRNARWTGDRASDRVQVAAANAKAALRQKAMGFSKNLRLGPKWQEMV
jgi:hypothetical protein